MHGDYTQQIEQAITLFADALLAAEPQLRQRGLDVDQDVLHLLRQVGRGVVQRVLGRLVDAVVTETAAANPELVVQRRAEITVEAVFGPVKIESPYLWAAGRSARPVKMALGLRHRQRSLAVQRALTDFGAEESFGQAATRFAEHYGWEVGRTSVLRLVEGIANEAEVFVKEQLQAARAEFDQPLATRPGCDRMLVELDGCEIRTGELVEMSGRERTPVRQQKRRRRKEEWRDVRVGLARRPEEVERTAVAYLGPYSEITDQLFSAAVGRGLSSRTKVIGVGDGGNGLREALAEKFPGMRYILDQPHIRSHLYETAEALEYREDLREAWVKERLDLMDEGQAVAALRKLRIEFRRRSNDRLRQLINHVERFKDAVHYARYRAEGLPCGSGEVESAHRSIPQKRLKLPGACWHPGTINPMLALRVLRANGWWEVFWRERAARVQAARALHAHETMTGVAFPTRLVSRPCGRGPGGCRRLSARAPSSGRERSKPNAPRRHPHLPPLAGAHRPNQGSPGRVAQRLRISQRSTASRRKLRDAQLRRGMRQAQRSRSAAVLPDVSGVRVRGRRGAGSGGAIRRGGHGVLPPRSGAVRRARRDAHVLPVSAPERRHTSPQRRPPTRRRSCSQGATRLGSR